MLDEHGENLEQAGPSTPVQVLGLTSVPSAGDLFLVAANDRDARQIAEKRQATERAAQLAKRRKIVSLEDIKEQFAKSEIDHLNIVIKGDSSGSVEALEESLMTRLRRTTSILRLSIRRLSSDLMFVRTVRSLILPSAKALKLSTIR